MQDPTITPATLGLLPHDRVIYRGDRVDLVLRPVITSAGQRIEREVCLHPGAVIILPLLDDGRIVLIRNRRHSVSQELLELPAGTLERGEDPAVCAARELQEETGYSARTVEPCGWFYTSPGILTEKMYAFVARGLTHRGQNLEDNEQIVVHPVTFAEARRLILQNQVVDAKTIATLLKYTMSAPQA